MTRPVQLGLYGCGNRTRALLESLEGEAAYAVVSAYDRREEAAKGLCERFGGRPCRDPDEMLDASGVEAVLISLDPFAHPEAFFKALARGKPIFIEKPLAGTVEEAARMTAAAQAANVPVQVGLIHRYYPAYKAALRYRQEHDPGTVFSMVYSWLHAGETEMINCHNLMPDNFRLRISQIPFHCCHALDLYRIFVGNIVAVDARGIKRLQRDYPSPDEVIALLEFENGAIGHFHYSSVCQGRECAYPAFINTENYTLSCSPGEYVVYQRPAHRSMRGELNATDCRQEWNRHNGPVRHRFDLNHFAAATAETLQDFLDAVRTGAPMKTPIEQGLWVAELAAAIELSWLENRRLELPLKLT